MNRLTLSRPIQSLIACGLLLCSRLCFAALPIEVSLLSGDPVKGEFVSLNAEAVTLKSEGKDQTLPLKNVLQIEFLHPEQILEKPNGPTIALSLTDGSALTATDIALGGPEFSANSLLLGEVKGPATAVKSILLGSLTATSKEQWSRFLDRDTKNDLLVIPKGESIDFVEGIIAGIDEKAIQFRLDGEEIAVARQKVFGLIFSRSPSEQDPQGQLLLSGGDKVSFTNLKLAGDTFEGTGPLMVSFSGSVERLRAIDLRQGRLVYLSELDPRLEEYTTFFDEPESFIKLRRDRNFDNGPIRLDNQTYKRGIVLHSKTLVRYRLGSDFRRFQATMGIEDLVGSGTASEAHVNVVIKADNTTLFEGEVKGGDPPLPLDYDVQGTRDLEILVDFGQNLSIQDHLALADARLIK